MTLAGKTGTISPRRSLHYRVENNEKELKMHTEDIVLDREEVEINESFLEGEIQPSEAELLNIETSTPELADFDDIGDDITLRYLSEIGKIPLLSKQDEFVLAIKVRSGDEKARDAFLKANARLVVHIAKTFTNREPGLPLLDLIQEGNMGLLNASRKFDPLMGFKFSTYATWWIRESIGRALMNKSEPIRIPVSLHHGRNKVKKARDELRDLNLREPTLEGIAKRAGLSIKYTREMLNNIYYFDSLDAPLSGNKVASDDLFVADTIEGTKPIDIELRQLGHAEILKFRNLVIGIFEKLKENGFDAKKIGIFKSRFGFDGTCEVKMLREVGEEFHIAKQRVSQITNEAWRLLREFGITFNDKKMIKEIERIETIEDIIGIRFDRRFK